MRKRWILGIALVALLSVGFYPGGGADQPDFPLIYIDEGCAGTHVGSQENPYDDLSDINWTTGGDNSIFDYLAGSPSQSPTIYLNKGDEWREQLTVDCSGTATYPIVLDSYGSGAGPIINGADLITPGSSWSNVESQYVSVVSQTGKDFIYLNLRYNNANTWHAQEWDATETFDLVRIRLWGKQVGTISGDIWVEVWDDSGGEPNAIIANGTSSTIDASTITTDAGGEEMSFTFGTPPTLTNGNKYFFVVRGDFAISTSNYMKFFGTSAVNGLTDRWTFTPLSEFSTYSFYIYVEKLNPNLWQATHTTDPKVVLFDDHYGYIQTTLGGVNSEYDWYWDSNVLYVYSTEDPDTAYTSPGIEAGVRERCLYIDGKSYISFDGIDFTTTTLYVIHLAGTQSNNTFIDCTFSNGYLYNFVPQAADPVTNITITDCISSRSGSSGIVATNKTGWTISGTTSTRDGIISSDITSDIFGAGIKFYGTDTADNTIESCTVELCGVRDDGYKPDSGTKGFGIWLDTVTASSGHEVIVRYNKVSGGSGAGLFCEKTEYTKWYYNISSDNDAQGLRVDADEDGPAVQENEFCNNVFRGNDIGIQSDGGWAEEANCNLNNTFKNNITVDNTTREFVAKRGGENDGTMGSGNIYTYNCLGAEAENFIEWGKNTYKSTYDDWETAYGETTNSVESDPLMTDPANGDFTLNPHSPCINAGTDVSLTEDYLGIKIRHAPDIGAYENQCNAIFLPTDIEQMDISFLGEWN